MGAYVNPVGMTDERRDKTVFLMDHGRRVTRGEVSQFNDFDGDELPVACLDNIYFLALGIAFNEREVKEFTNPGDGRFIEYYMVPKDVLYENSDLEKYLPKGE